MEGLNIKIIRRYEMSVVDFRQKKLTATEKKEKARAKKIYNSFLKIRKEGGSISPDPFTVEFLKKYGYEV